MSEAEIRWIGGPVLHARVTRALRDWRSARGRPRAPAGRSDQARRRGIRRPGLRGHDRAATRATRVPAPGGPLSVPLGPGLLGHIFDGLLRPLERRIGPRASGVRVSPARRSRPDARGQEPRSARCSAPAPRQSVSPAAATSRAPSSASPEGHYPVATRASARSARPRAGSHDVGFVQHVAGAPTAAGRRTLAAR